VTQIDRKIIIVLVLILISILILMGLLVLKRTKKSEEIIQKATLLEKLNNSSVIMWIGAHPDDELFTAGTFGYFTRNLNGHLVIVSLYFNPEFLDENRESAEFLGNADYIRIEEELETKLPRCMYWGQVDSVVNKLEEMGVKDYVKEIILEYRPDIVFTFESTNGFRHSCQHISIARIVDKAVRELYDEGYTFFDYYYVLNRDPSLFGEKNMDPLPVTDVIDLTEEMWSYKLRVFDIYSKYYPKLKTRN